MIGRGLPCTKRNAEGNLTCQNKQQNGGLCRKHYQLSMRGKPTGQVDPGPAIAHIRDLGEAGVSQKRVGELTGIPQLTIWQIARGNRKKILASTADKILSVPLPNAAWNVAHPKATIPMIGTQRRLRALMAAGFTAEMIAPRIGVHKRAVVKLTANEHQPYVWARTARAVADLFEEWRLITGPSNITRSRSASKGWDLPSAWDVDEIDNPNAKPSRSHASFPEQIADYRSIGYTDDEIAEAIGMTMKQLKSRLTYYKLPSGRRYRDIEDHQAMLYDNTMSRKQLNVS